MLVFIDESGDPGFKVQDGASPIFVAAMVIFDTPEDAAAAQTCILSSKARQDHKGEFKFNKCSDDIRDKFCDSVENCVFSIRSIVVRKEIIYSPRLKADKDKFYEYFVKMMMAHDNGVLNNARIVIDGSGDREFRQRLNTALRRKIGAGTIKDVRFKDSKSDVLIQLADMCAGAIARSYRIDRANAARWRRALAPRIQNVWEFR